MITKPLERPTGRPIHTEKRNAPSRAEFDWFLLVLILALTLGVAFIGSIAYVVLLG